MPKLDTYEANVRVRDLPRSVDDAISRIAGRRNCNKWEVVRDALIEYARNHKEEADVKTNTVTTVEGADNRA